jgi:hypothetical protein
MDAEAIAIDHPDASIIDFVEKSGLVPRGMSARFERLPGGVSSDIWLVHADDQSFCVKRALAQLRVAADWRAPIERNTKEAGWIKAVAGFLPEAVPSLLAEDAAAGMFAMDYLNPVSVAVGTAKSGSRMPPRMLPKTSRTGTTLGVIAESCSGVPDGGWVPFRIHCTMWS